MDLTEVTLTNVGGEGALEALFRRELEKVAADISDLNTKPRAVRTITLTVTFKPDEARQMAAVTTSSDFKAAKVRPGDALVWFKRRHGKTIVLGGNPDQLTLDDAVPESSLSVTPGGRNIAT